MAEDIQFQELEVRQENLEGRLDEFSERQSVMQNDVIEIKVTVKQLKEQIETLLSKFGKFSDKVYENVVCEFNKLQQHSSVAEYHKKFEDLKAVLLLRNKGLSERYFVDRFIDGLQEEIRHTVQRFRPKLLYHAINLAKLREFTMGLDIKDSQSTNRTTSLSSQFSSANTRSLPTKTLAQLEIADDSNHLTSGCLEKEVVEQDYVGLSSEASSYTELDLGLGLSLVSCGNGGVKANTNKQPSWWGEYGRILSAKDFPSIDSAAKGNRPSVCSQSSPNFTSHGNELLSACKPYKVSNNSNSSESEVNFSKGNAPTGPNRTNSMTGSSSPSFSLHQALWLKGGDMFSLAMMKQPARPLVASSNLWGTVFDRGKFVIDEPCPKFEGILQGHMLCSKVCCLTAKQACWLGTITSEDVVVLDGNMGACLFGFELLKSRVAVLVVTGASQVFLICFGVCCWYHGHCISSAIVASVLLGAAVCRHLSDANSLDCNLLQMFFKVNDTTLLLLGSKETMLHLVRTSAFRQFSDIHPQRLIGFFYTMQGTSKSFTLQVVQPPGVSVMEVKDQGIANVVIFPNASSDTLKHLAGTVIFASQIWVTVFDRGKFVIGEPCSKFEWILQGHMLCSEVYCLMTKEAGWLGTITWGDVVVLDWNRGACLFWYELPKSRVAALVIAGSSLVFLICFAVHYWNLEQCISYAVVASVLLGVIVDCHLSVTNPLDARRDVLQSSVIRPREGFRRKGQNSGSSSHADCGSSGQLSNSIEAGHLTLGIEPISRSTTHGACEVYSWKHSLLSCTASSHEGIDSDRSIDTARPSLALHSSSCRSVQETEVGVALADKHFDHNSSLMVSSRGGLEIQGCESSTSILINQLIRDSNLACVFQESLNYPRLTSMLEWQESQGDVGQTTLSHHGILNLSCTLALEVHRFTENGLVTMAFNILQMLLMVNDTSLLHGIKETGELQFPSASTAQKFPGKHLYGDGCKLINIRPYKTPMQADEFDRQRNTMLDSNNIEGTTIWCSFLVLNGCYCRFVKQSRS